MFYYLFIWIPVSHYLSSNNSSCCAIWLPSGHLSGCFDSLEGRLVLVLTPKQAPKFAIWPPRGHFRVHFSPLGPQGRLTATATPSPSFACHCHQHTYSYLCSLSLKRKRNKLQHFQIHCLLYKCYSDSLFTPALKIHHHDDIRYNRDAHMSHSRTCTCTARPAHH